MPSPLFTYFDGCGYSKPESLVINIFCRWRGGLLHDICRVLLKLGFNVQNSSWLASEGQMSIMLTVNKEGGVQRADAARVKSALRECQNNGEDFSCNVLPSTPFAASRVALPIEVMGLDRPGIVADVAAKLDDHSVEIISLETSVFPMEGAGVPMFRSKMNLCINPATLFEYEFESPEEEFEELTRILHDVELELDHDIQMILIDDIG